MPSRSVANVYPQNGGGLFGFFLILAITIATNCIAAPTDPSQIPNAPSNDYNTASRSSSVKKEKRHAPGVVLVKLKPSEGMTKLKHVVESYGLRLGDAVIPELGIFKVHIPPGLLTNENTEKSYAELLKGDERRVIDNMAEPDYLYEPAATTPNDPQYSGQWHLPKISAPTAWDISTGSTSIKIAILDTGVNPHPDLSSKLVPGWNVYNNSSDTSDVYGHGTQVAGVAAAVTNNSVGIAGVAWGPKIMPVRISDYDGSAYSSTIAQGLVWAANNGARIANISFSNIANDPIIGTGAYYFQLQGGLVIAAAGINWALTAADDPLILSVNATDQNDELATFCFAGTYADIAAPGVDILTTNAAGGYGLASGLSMASPIAAGVAALVMTVNPSLSPARVVQTIKQTALDLGPSGYDLDYGAGRLNAQAAVSLAQNGGPAPSNDTTPPTLQINSPSSGHTVSGSVLLQLAVSDNVGLASVNLSVDGTLIWVNTSAPFDTLFWSSETVANGLHVLRVEAVDRSFNKTDVSVSVNVSNGVDSIAPELSIVCPRSDATFSGIRDVVIGAVDRDSALASVSISVDGGSTIASLPNAEPHAVFAWDTRALSNGTHTLTATASDLWGNSSVLSMPLTVRNIGGDTTAPLPPRLTEMWIDTTDHTPTLVWNAVTDPSGVSYRLLVSTDSFFVTPHAIDITVASTTYTPSTPLVSGEYYWRVDAIDGAGNIEGCGPIGFLKIRDQDVTLPPAPALISPANGAALTNIVNFTWDSVSDLSGVFYQIQIDNSGSTFPSPEVDVSNLSTASYTRYIGLAVGTYSWRVRARDGATPPNYSVWSSARSLTINASTDITPPSTPTLLSPGNAGSTTDATPIFDWTDVSDTSGVGYQIQVDNSGSGFASPEVDAVGYFGGSTYTSLTPLELGAYSWRVRTFDGAGLVSSWSQIWSLTIAADTVAPTTPVLFAPSNNSSTEASQPVFDWSDSTDTNTVSYELLVTDSFYHQYYNIYQYGLSASQFDFSMGIPGQTLIPLQHGTYAWRVRAFDGTNYSPWTPAWVFAVTDDTGLPGVPAPLSPPNNSSTSNETPVFQWSYVSDASGYEFRLYNNLMQIVVEQNVGASQYLIAPWSLSPGTYTWQVRSYRNGNYSVWSNISALTILSGTGGDTTAPNITITSPTPDSTVSFSTEVLAPATDNVGIAAIRLYIDDILTGTAFSPTFSQYINWQLISNGQHTLQLEAVDTSGNATSAYVAVNVNNPVDIYAPNWLEFTCPPMPGGATLSGIQNLAVTALDAGGGLSSVVVSVDGAVIGGDSAHPFAYSWNTATVANGAHTLRVDATDHWGNAARSEIPITVRNIGTDVTAPSAPALMAPLHNATASSMRPTFDWSDVSDPSGVTYRLILDYDSWDGPFYSPETIINGLTSSSYTPTTDLLRGNYWWKVEAVDGNGNVQPCGDYRYLTVPNTNPVPPAPTLLAPAAGAIITSRTPMFDWSDSPTPGAYYTIQVDNDADFSSTVVWNGVSASNYTTQPLANGTYYWRVAAETSAQGPWSVARTFTINSGSDTTAPASPVLSSPANNTRLSIPAGTRIVFDWADVSDPSGAYYEIQLDNSGATFPSPEINQGGHSDSRLLESKFTTWISTVPILADGTYLWRVRASDGAGNAGAWTPSPWTLIVDTTGPTAPTLLAPANSSTTSNATPAFDWSDATDPSGVRHYRLEIQNSNFQTEYFKTNITGSSFTLPTALNPGLHYWRVGVEDTLGNVGPMSARFSFRVPGDTTPPIAPTLLSPQNGNTTFNAAPTFDWASVFDASGVTYRIQADNSGAGFSSPEVNVSNLSRSYFAQPTALPAGVYSWRVMATDAAGNPGPWSSVWSVGINQLLAPAPRIDFSIPLDGYIDPLEDRNALSGELLGTKDVYITFSSDVQNQGGGAITLANFQRTYYRGGVSTPLVVAADQADLARPGQAPVVTLMGGSGAGPYQIRFEPRLPLGAWTVIRAVNMENTDGVDIDVSADKIVLGVLPMDIDQDGKILGSDINRWLAILNEDYDPAPLDKFDLLDQLRDGYILGSDMHRAQQLINGTPGTTLRAWTSAPPSGIELGPKP